MLTTTASRTLSRQSVSRLAALRNQRYASGTPVPPPGVPPHQTTQPGARPGAQVPPPQAGGPGNIAIFGGVAAIGGLAIYYFTRPNEAAKDFDKAQAKLSQAGDKAGDAMESLKAAGQEKFEEFKHEAQNRGKQLEAEAERLKAQGNKKWEEVKRQADHAYTDASKETESLAEKAKRDLNSVLHQGEAKATEVKAEAKEKAAKKGWFS